MVNDADSGISTKGRLLARLRELAGAPISGEELARALGVSRVAVWKAATSLREAGYSLEASEDGYRLDPATEKDFLYPWEFGDRERSFRHYGETTSTMDRARELADRGVEPFSVVVAERQSAGRGRAGRPWESNEGGLFFTLILPGGTPALRYARVSAAAQLAVAAAVRKTTGAAAKPRWPNDVFVDGRKIAGALVEFEAEGDLTRKMAVGVGINVNNRQEGTGKIALTELTRRKVSRREVLLAFLEAFDRENPFVRGQESIARRWNETAYGVGARVALIDAKHGDDSGAEGDVSPFGSGIFRGIDDLGRAIVETPAGVVYMEAGSASIRF